MQDHEPISRAPLRTLEPISRVFAHIQRHRGVGDVLGEERGPLDNDDAGI